MRIAVIGSGISGNGAAYALAQARHEVVVYERRLRPGGHSATVDIDHGGTPLSVDTGFIVYNERNYPNLTALFAHLGVATETSEMSFSVSAANGRMEWGNKRPLSLFAQKRNALSPSFLWMIREILRFNRHAIADLRAGLSDDEPLGAWLDRHRFGGRMLADYLLPMGGAIWSTPRDRMRDFPARSFLAFYDNHGLIHFGNQPQWRTVTGGSRRYVEAITKPVKLRLGTEVVAVRRSETGVLVRDASGAEDTFDEVIVAAHSDQALALLGDPSAEERALLSAIRYRPNRVFLHRDPALMPKRRAAWASWNYLAWPTTAGADVGDEVAVTYWMNSLQNIDERLPVFVSLNPPFDPDPALTFGRYAYDHPQYDAAALAAQRGLAEIQGKRHTWYCGAYHGYGFHEDGLRSGLAVARALGAVPPFAAADARLPELRDVAE